MKLIQIGGDSRTGGSLVARLLDGHSQVMSIPFEFELFRNRTEAMLCADDYSPQAEQLAKSPALNKIKKYAYNELPSKNPHNEDNRQTLDFKGFIGGCIRNYEAAQEKGDAAFINSVYASFFQNWTPTSSAYSETVAYCCNHNSRSFMADIGRFLALDPGNVFIHTLRSPYGQLASMKNYWRLYKDMDGTQNQQTIEATFPGYVKTRWLISLYFGLKLKLKKPEQVQIIKFEELLNDPRAIMEQCCTWLDIPFEDTLLHPTIGGRDWKGNSSFGAMPSSVSKRPLDYTQKISVKEAREVAKGIDHLLLPSDSFPYSSGSYEEKFGGLEPLLPLVESTIREQFGMNKIVDSRLREIHAETFTRMRKYVY